MSDVTTVEGPFLNPERGMFILVDEETNERWLREEIYSCDQAVLDEEADLERHAEDVSSRIEKILEERLELVERLMRDCR